MAAFPEPTGPGYSKNLTINKIKPVTTETPFAIALVCWTGISLTCGSVCSVPPRFEAHRGPPGSERTGPHLCSKVVERVLDSGARKPPPHNCPEVGSTSLLWTALSFTASSSAQPFQPCIRHKPLDFGLVEHI